MRVVIALVRVPFWFHEPASSTGPAGSRSGGCEGVTENRGRLWAQAWSILPWDSLPLRVSQGNP